MTAPLPIVEKLRERITVGYHSDGYAMIGRDKDGNPVFDSRPSTPMTRPANRDGPEAADIIEELYEALAAIAHEARLSADEYGCANCNAHAEQARAALAKARGDQ